MVKILLVADLHLGICQPEAPVKTADRIVTLKKIASLAKDHDILLVAGDLFDSVNPGDELISEVSKLFAYLKKQGTSILISPGEHEFHDGKSANYLLSIDADRIFDDPSGEPFKVEKKNEAIWIYGGPPFTENDMSKTRRIEADGFHIGLFHTDIEFSDTAGTKQGFHIKDMKSLDLDFYALGHNHFFKLYKYQNEIIGAYPGSPEATDTSETGDRYVLSLSVENNEITQIKRLTVNTVSIIKQEFNCQFHSASDLISAIEKNRSPRCIFIVTLSGERSFLIPTGMIDTLSKDFYSFKLIDQSNSDIETFIAKKSSDKSVSGDYFALLVKKMQDGLPSSVNEKQLTNLLLLFLRDDITITEDSLCELLDA